MGSFLEELLEMSFQILYLVRIIFPTIEGTGIRWQVFTVDIGKLLSVRTNQVVRSLILGRSSL